MKRLEKLHPFSQLLFFALTLIVPLILINPYFSLASLLAAVLYIVISDGRKSLKTLIFSLLAVLFVGIFNMAFVHRGETVLFTVKNSAFTLEALCYGFNQGMLLASVLIWFMLLGKCIDSERVIYLFRFSPKLALIFSMVLGFIPRFTRKAGEIRESRLALAGGKTPEGLNEKFRFAVQNFSALVSYSLESSIITSKSMEARGYNPKAVRTSRFKVSVFDTLFMIINALILVLIVANFTAGNIDFVFQPAMYMRRLSLPALILFFVAELYPFFSILWENIKWKLLSVKA